MSVLLRKRNSSKNISSVQSEISNIKFTEHITCYCLCLDYHKIGVNVPCYVVAVYFPSLFSSICSALIFLENITVSKVASYDIHRRQTQLKWTQGLA